MSVNGYCDSKFIELREYFEESINSKFELGAAISIEIEGESVINLWGGYQDANRRRAWEEDTLCNTFSVSKAMTSACILKLIEERKIDLNEKVSFYWPEYGCNGKEDTKIIDLLTHRAGMFAFEDNFKITNEDWTNWNLFVTKLAKQKPFYTPGSAQSYHALTFGFLVGEVVRRVDGRSLGTYFKEKIADAYNIDFIFGLDNEDIKRTSDIVMSKIRSPILAKAFFSMPSWLLPKRIRPVVSLLKESDFQKAFFNTQTEKNSVNSNAWKKAEIPAANGFASAKGISRFYSALSDLNGNSFIKRETLELAIKVHSSGPDTVLLNLPIKFGLGFMIENPYSPLGQNPDLFGHSGVGGSVGFADKKRGIGFGFTKNYMHPPGKLFKSANDLTKLFYSIL